jgi:hypothetical protein
LRAGASVWNPIWQREEKTIADIDDRSRELD